MTGAVVPASASAAVLTLTMVNHGSPNWVSVVPADVDPDALLAENRLVSNVNVIERGRVGSNLVQAPLAGGAAQIVCGAPCDVVVDLLGWYEPVSGAVTAGGSSGSPRRPARSIRGSARDVRAAARSPRSI